MKLCTEVICKHFIRLMQIMINYFYKEFIGLLDTVTSKPQSMVWVHWSMD